MLEKLKQQLTFKRISITLIGLVLLALGTTLCLLGNVGIDPFTAMTVAVSTHFGLGLGGFQLGVNCVFLIAVLIWQRGSLGVGTVINMVCVGYMVQFMRAGLGALIPTNGGWLQSAILLIVGIFVMTLGVGCYFATDLGVAPYDGLAQILTAKIGGKYQYWRIFTDFVVVAISAFYHGPLGIATILIAFFTGPLVVFWQRQVARVFGLASLRSVQS